MSKRGQVFILAAIIIAVILFSLAVVKNKFEQKTIIGDFETLAENFQIEASKLVNSAIESKIDAHEAFKSFSTMFTSYAKGKNPEFGLLYVLSYGNKVQVTNFLDRAIAVQGCNPDTGEYYSVNISGGFKNVPADIRFEEFDIAMGETPAELGFPCWDVPSLSGEITVPNTHFCAFLPTPGLGTEIKFSVVVDGAPYHICAVKGVPELMQVSTMKQGEQAKVRGTGKCIGKDFCSTFISQTACEDTCGRDVCCWWATGICISSYSYPTMCGAGATCYPTSNILCCYENSRCYYNSCGDPAPGGFIGTCETGKVCRDQSDGVSPTQCCKKEGKKKCCDTCNEDVYWYNDCSPSTKEDLAENCLDTEICRDDITGGLPSGTESECCTKKDHTECYENDIYWYYKCPDSGYFIREENWDTECNEATHYICRDKDDDPSFLQARCCQQNWEKKCYNNDLYWFDGCGIKGNLAEDCVYCDPINKKCCVQNFEKKCYNNDLYWFDSCGNKGNLAEDCVYCDTINKKCCVQNFEKKCYNNDLYYYDNCGNKGSLAEDCTRYCQGNKCCIQQAGQTCSGDYKYICDYHDDCGNEADCNTDCSKDGKVCVCDSGGCKCKNKGYIFTCRKYYTETECDDCPSCDDGWTASGDCWDYDDCYLFWTEYARTCYQDYKTDCLISPSCQDHEDKVGEETCSNPSG